MSKSQSKPSYSNTLYDLPLSSTPNMSASSSTTFLAHSVPSILTLHYFFNIPGTFLSQCLYLAVPFALNVSPWHFHMVLFLTSLKSVLTCHLCVRPSLTTLYKTLWGTIPRVGNVAQLPLGKASGCEVQQAGPTPTDRFSCGESGLHCTYDAMRLAFAKTPSPWIEAANVY